MTAHQQDAGTKARIWTPIFVLTIIITFFAFISGQGLNTGMSVYIETKGGSTTFSGILMGVFTLAAAISRIVVGSIIDRRGRKIVMLAGFVVLAVGILLCGLMPTAPILVIGRFLQGLGFAAATTAAATAAEDTLPNERMSEGVSYYGLGQALATSIGPAFALFLIDTNPSENLFYVLALVSVIAFILTLFCSYERHPEMLQEKASYREELAAKQQQVSKEDSNTDKTQVTQTEGASTSSESKSSNSSKEENQRGIRAFFEPRALPGAIPMLFMSAAFGFCVSFVGLYGEVIGIGSTGLFYTFSAISMIVIRLASKPLMASMAPIKTFAIATVCGIVAFVLLIFSPNVEVLFYLAGIFYGIDLGISLPLNQSVAVNNTPPERWGATNALYLLASDVGMGVAAVIWGIVNDAFGFTTTLIIVIACVIVSYILALIVYPPEAKGKKPASSK